MTRAVRRITLVAGILLGLLVVAALAIPRLVDVNTYRGLIQSRAQEAMGRPVTLGAMTLSLFPGVGIAVEEPEVEGLLRARSLTVGVRLLPLLFGGAIDVRKVILEKPDITVSRSSDGRWSFEGIGAPREAAGQGAGQAPAAEPRPFSLGRLEVRGGTIRLSDSKGRARPVEIQAQIDLTASVSGSGAGDLKGSFEGSLSAQAAVLRLRGSLDRGAGQSAPARFDVTVDQADLDLPRTRELLAAFDQPWPLPEGLLGSRTLRLGGRLRGETAAGRATRLDLTDVVAQEAEILLSRDPRGRWNVESLGATQPAGAPAGAQSSLELTMKNLRLAGATVRLHDEATGGAAVDLSLRDLTLVVEEFTPGRPLVAQLETRVDPGAGRLRVGGTLPVSFEKDAAGARVDAELEIEALDLKPIAPYLASVLGIKADAGALSAKGKLSGEYPRSLSASGTISLARAMLTGHGEPIDASARFEMTAADAASRIEVRRLDLEVGRSRLGVTGSLVRTQTSAIADLTVPPSSIDAADLARLLALAGADFGMSFSSRSPVRLEARVRGDLRNRAELSLAGSLEVSGFTFRHPTMSRPLEQVGGKVTLIRDGFDVTGFSGVIGASDVAGSLSIRGLDRPAATFSLTSRRADFWELMSFLKQEPDAPGAGGSGGASSSAGEDYLSRISARGTMAIARGSFDTLSFSDLSTTLSLADRVVRLDPVSMKLYGGSMNGSASMDLGRDPAVYTVSARAGGVDTEALLSANLGMKGMLSGSLSSDVTITSSGASQQEVLRNAAGGGQVTIEAGRVGALNVLKVLSRASDLLGERSLKEVSGKLSSEGTDFSSMTAKLKVGGGRIVSQELRLVSPDLELRDDGQLDMLAGTIQIAGEILFSESLSQAMVDEKSRAVDYFWDTRRGRVNLPLRMSGPIASPTPNIDWGSAGGRLARRKVQERLAGRLEEAGLGSLLSPDGAKPPERSRPPDAPKLQPAPPADGEPAGAGQQAGPRIDVEEQEFTGNLLLPDLKLKGALRGTGIVSAEIRVLDSKGRLVHTESLAEKIGRYYATRDRSAPATITFRVTVEGRKLAGLKGDVTVEITAQDGGGESTRRVTVSR